MLAFKLAKVGVIDKIYTIPSHTSKQIIGLDVALSCLFVITIVDTVVYAIYQPEIY